MNGAPAQAALRALSEALIREALDVTREAADQLGCCFDAESHAAEGRGDLVGAAFHAALSAVYREVALADRAAELIVRYDHDPFEELA